MKERFAPAALTELLCQALETEMGGVQVYETAVRCAVNEDLKEEWEEYLEQTRNHEKIVRGVFSALGLDEGMETPGRAIVRSKGEGLVAAMEEALKGGEPEKAQLVACECVVDAETKDHLNWELIGELSKTIGGEPARVLKSAYEEVEDEEDEHLYHTQGWCRELWMETLGLPAVIPPPEETRDVKTALEAARAKESRRPKAGASGSTQRRSRTPMAARRTGSRGGSSRSSSSRGGPARRSGGRTSSSRGRKK